MIKKIVFIIILIVFLTGKVYAKSENLALTYGKPQYACTHSNTATLQKTAEKYIKRFENAKTDAERKYCLQEAMRYYFLLSKTNIHSIEAQIGLGRIYDALKQDKLAKKHFYTAFNSDNNNPKMNFYFAEYYFKRHDYISALNYYETALHNGYSNNFYLNYQLGVTYEKLADLETAGRYYKKALSLSPQNKELINKIGMLNKLNYSESQYYLFNR